jgi:hypothetical protein
VKRCALLLVVLIACAAPTPQAGRAPRPAGATTTPTTNADASEVAAISAVYLRSRDLDVHAFAALDAAGLDEVYAEYALDGRRDEIARRRAEGRPMAVRVEPHFRVTVLRPDFAFVDDDVVNHSVRLDPVGGVPVEADPNEVLQETYTLRKVDGRWKVTFIARVGD